MTDPALYNRINSAGRAARHAHDAAERGAGHRGQLLHDKQLYDNLNSAATEMRGLVSDIRKDPQKYLRVKVSIF